jgi:hypothetical protein
MVSNPFEMLQGKLAILTNSYHIVAVMSWQGWQGFRQHCIMLQQVCSEDSDSPCAAELAK